MTTTTQTMPELNSERLRRAFAQAMHDHWRFFLLEGIVLVILGSLAIIVPAIASLALEIFIGWLLLAGGAMGLAGTLFGHRVPGFWWSMLSAVLAIVAGGLLVWSPIGGVLSLTFLLSVYFLVDGFASIMFAIDHRRHYSKTWGWLLASGVFDLLLAGLIILGLPGTAAWVIGLVVGIDLVFGGWSLIAVALGARTATI